MNIDEIKTKLDAEWTNLSMETPWKIKPIYRTNSLILYSAIHHQAYIFNGDDMMEVSTEELGGTLKFIENMLKVPQKS